MVTSRECKNFPLNGPLATLHLPPSNGPKATLAGLVSFRPFSIFVVGETAVLGCCSVLSNEFHHRNPWNHRLCMSGVEKVSDQLVPGNILAPRKKKIECINVHCNIIELWKDTINNKKVLDK